MQNQKNSELLSADFGALYFPDLLQPTFSQTCLEVSTAPVEALRPFVRRFLSDEIDISNSNKGFLSIVQSLVLESGTIV